MINYTLQSHKPLREIVYEELKRQIMVGEIPPRTRMMEVELADEMGVSRTPVREAIRKLEKEGLVQIEPRCGAYASDISIKDILDVLEVREELEGMATALATQKITEDEKEALKATTEAYRQVVDNGDIDEIIRLDAEFHKQVVNASGNKTLIQMVSQVQDLALRFRYLYYDDFTRFKNQPLEHEHILESILSGNAEKARSDAQHHLAQLKEFVISEASNLQRRK